MSYPGDWRPLEPLMMGGIVMPDKRFTKQISLWLTEAELARLDLLVSRSGLSRRAYLRHLIKGVIPADRPPLDYFVMMRELHSIGNNLNQIARQAYATGVIDEARYKRNIAKLDEAIKRITAAVELPRGYE